MYEVRMNDIISAINDAYDDGVWVEDWTDQGSVWSFDYDDDDLDDDWEQ